MARAGTVLLTSDREAEMSNVPLCFTILGCCVMAAGPRAAETTPDQPLKIDSVPARYTVQDSSFEVNPQNGRAGIRLEYDFPPARLGGNDYDQAPPPKTVTVAGLRYEPSTRTIVFDKGTTRVTCATESSRRTLFWKTSFMKPTGKCLVESHVIRHAQDNGWTVDPSSTLDTFFEAH